MIIDCFDNKTKPLMSLMDFYGERKYHVNTCLIVFSKEIHDHLLNQFNCEKIAELKYCNGTTAIYKFNYQEKTIAFYLTAIGSALASAMCCEANWVTGATQFIMFGSCGSLAYEITCGKYIIPTESYRGEGCSYYYAPAQDYIKISNCLKVAKIFDQNKIPYVLGKVWTTDSMLRETEGLMLQRKKEGCIAVEMEVAGVQAICDFYGFELYNFLEAGDVLSTIAYDVSGLHAANHNLDKLYIALLIAVSL